VFAAGGVMLAGLAFVLPVKLWRGAGFVLMACALAVLSARARAQASGIR
jgi:hypothetical protein